MMAMGYQPDWNNLLQQENCWRYSGLKNFALMTLDARRDLVYSYFFSSNQC